MHKNNQKKSFRKDSNQKKSSESLTAKKEAGKSCNQKNKNCYKLYNAGECGK